MKVGFVVNPIAGMGGSVGLKGTDGIGIQTEAVRRGAARIAPARAVAALRSLAAFDLEIEFLTCSGAMGADELDKAGLSHSVVSESPETTTREDTIRAVTFFKRVGVVLVIFAGGDGTARDVYQGTQGSIPIIGVPAGVKMHSAVFLNKPEDLGPVVSSFLRDPITKPGEVMDIDEDLFRMGILRTKLYGVVRIPDDRVHVQSGKATSNSLTAKDEATEIAHQIAETMKDTTSYIIGPGTTTAAIGEVLGIKKTLLGVDVVKGRSLVMQDVSERDLTELLEKENDVMIIVSPVGAQGFFFGRGNQQISAKVIGRVGRNNIMVIATPTKLAETPVLRVDTGDQSIDSEFKGRMRVITGYRRKRLVEVR